MNLNNLGWNEFFQHNFDKLGDANLIPARVAREHKEIYHVFSELGEMAAQVSGRYRFNCYSRADFPSVGDWVTIVPVVGESKAIIQNLLPRKTQFSRKAVLSPGETEEQILSANIDIVFIVTGLDGNFKIRRLERYVSIAYDSGAKPVIILNKADLVDDFEQYIEKVKEIAIDLPIHPVSARQKTGLENLTTHLETGKTAVFLGSSGVGKSTIINGLIGTELLKTTDVRIDDSRGRHTTTHREMILLDSGGIVIDTPGMREIQAWDNQDGLSKTFSDIEELVGHCKFTDCQHNSEPGCAVKAAIEIGELDAHRFNNYLKLQKEMKYLEARKDQRARLDREDKWKKIMVAHRKQAKFARKMKNRGSGSK
ncbi:MAG: ribosome small subunit-dependent GTPase A [Candidatus Zixiibacteriota bacterium]